MLLDFINYELGSPVDPKLYMSNSRLYSFPQMLGFLLLAPFAELASIASQPAKIARTRGVPRAILEVPLAILRVLLALLNVPVGFLALSLRALDLLAAGAMGERPREDAVAVARVRQGGLEAEGLAAEFAERGSTLRDELVGRWDKKFSLTKVPNA